MLAGTAIMVPCRESHFLPVVVAGSEAAIFSSGTPRARNTPTAMIASPSGFMSSAVNGQPPGLLVDWLLLQGRQEHGVQIDKLTLLLGGNLFFGLDVLEQPLVAFLR